MILVDTSVWSLALQKCKLLTADKDFEAVARHFPLRLA